MEKGSILESIHSVRNGDFKALSEFSAVEYNAMYSS